MGRPLNRRKATLDISRTGTALPVDQGECVLLIYVFFDSADGDVIEICI